ncbi:MAG: biopolymer transporter ExbD [Deltaproteobacteria bacterium]|nr:biopolymer transporter ExbD [Deltaproteobacteria bacterium]
MGFLRHKSEEPKIDLTPMVDVVFLLLIFFMISTTFIETSGISIQLPSVSSPAPPSREEKEVRISVTAEGNIFHHHPNSPKPEPLTEEEMDRLLEHYGAEEAGQMTFFLLADRDSRHGKVVKVMDSARKHGFRKLAIGTLTEKGLKP